MAGPDKAYKNLQFLNSAAARHIRILCEYEEPRARFREHNIRNTIVFFGSARSRPVSQCEMELEDARRAHALGTTEDELRRFGHQLKMAERRMRLSQFYEKGRELAARLAAWDLNREARRRYFVCTGGGPGMMEAANRGASDVVGARNVGLGISLPFEEKLNPYVTPELGFEFHYFFMRKYWFMYLCKALILMPGGFGTMDELFESLTLRQTAKIKSPLPTVLFGGEFWKDILDFQAMVDWGVISESDLLLFQTVNTVDEAFDYITHHLEINEVLHPNDGADE